MNTQQSLRNHFLIAMPGLEDPNFHHTVTYICEHNADGAMGIIINRPMGVALAEVLSQLEIEPAKTLDPDLQVFRGGPVQPEHGFVIHTQRGIYDSTMRISDEVSVTTSKDILSAIAHNEGPGEFLIALGYAGWEAGQLEQEIADNLWLNGPATNNILFDIPVEQRWNEAAHLLGVDLNLMSSDIGHA